MKVLLSWLREFAPFEGDPISLGEEMSDLGMAVESLETIGQSIEGIVVAKVLGLRVHPDADKIQLVDVDIGEGEALQICCGAFNMAVGDHVPLATLGSIMPGGMKIERRKLRGQWSNGMLCSAKEMGLGDDHEGILVLPQDSTLGVDIKDALGIVPDVLYDLEINPNRPDAMSVAGVARDLAARMRLPFTQISPVVAESALNLSTLASLEIIDADLCGRFLVRVLNEVTVGHSPQWMANRLTHAGMRPINSVVDASNYVMVELGQPNHTYDLSAVPGGALRVRWAREGETIRTLDELDRVLTSRDGVIANGDDEVIGIAGVMGGASTEISKSTSSVLLEMAWWDPMSIARTSARLGLRSEASMRFERGADPEVVELAALRFAELLASTGATLAAGVIDKAGRQPDRSPVRVRTQRVEELLGVSFSDEDIQNLLTPIGFAVTPAASPEGDSAQKLEAASVTDSVQDVVIPSFRPDTTTETDIIEEIARHHGYGRIPRVVPLNGRTGRLSGYQLDRRAVRQVMVGLGFDEAFPLPFLSPTDIANSGLDGEFITVTNPLDAAESVLRTSLLTGLLKTVAFNESHRSNGVRLFEIGKVFPRPPEGRQLPDEREELGTMIAGSDGFAAVDVWHVLSESLGFGASRLVQVGLPGLHPTRSAEIFIDDHRIGAVGEIDPAALEAFAISERVAWLEVDLGRLLALPHDLRSYKQVSRFPSSDIDLAFEVSESIPAADIEGTITVAAAPLLAGVRLFDVYRGAGVGSENRSLAYRLRLQAHDRTLNDRDINEVRDRVADAVRVQHGAELRV